MKSFNTIIKKLLPGLLIVILISGFIYWINSKMDIDCLALSAFRPTLIKDFFNSIILSGTLGIILIAGFVIYLKIQKTGKVNVILYFMILSLIISIQNIKGIYNHYIDRAKKIKEQICNKSTDDGMLCEFKDLTCEEYFFISKDSKLPIIPDNSKDITIHFFRDDFFVDYNLVIDIWIPEQKSESNIVKDWTKTKETVNGFIKYEYQQSQN